MCHAVHLYRVTAHFSRGSLNYASTFHVIAKDTSAPLAWVSADPSPAALLAELDTRLRTAWRATLDTSSTFVRWHCATITPPNDDAAVGQVGELAVGQVGTGTTANNLPQWLALMTTYLTDYPGRSFRGRMYSPPLLSESSIGGGLVMSVHPQLVSWKAFQVEFMKGVKGGSTWGTLWTDTWSAAPVVYSRTRHARGQDPYWSYIKSAVTVGQLHHLDSRKK
jgi:hypothetical protein